MSQSTCHKLVAPARSCLFCEAGHDHRNSREVEEVTGKVNIRSDSTEQESRVNSYAANKASKTAPVPLAPAEADGVLFSIHDLVAFPAYADAVDPSPTIHAYYSRLCSNGVAGRFLFFPAQCAFVGVLWWVA